MTYRNYLLGEEGLIDQRLVWCPECPSSLGVPSPDWTLEHHRDGSHSAIPAVGSQAEDVSANGDMVANVSEQRHVTQTEET